MIRKDWSRRTLCQAALLKCVSALSEYECSLRSVVHIYDTASRKLRVTYCPSYTRSTVGAFDRYRNQFASWGRIVSSGAVQTSICDLKGPTCKAGRSRSLKYLAARTDDRDWRGNRACGQKPDTQCQTKSKTQPIGHGGKPHLLVHLEDETNGPYALRTM
jgi:hypothetical protein